MTPPTEAQVLATALRLAATTGHSTLQVRRLMLEAADKVTELEEALRLAWTAIERSTPNRADDVRWVLDTVLPKLRETLR